MSMLKEGRIILPLLRNDGQTPLAETHKRLATLLTAAFGGCTVMFGTGMYDNPGKGLQVEEIYQYTMAYEPTAANDNALRAIAREIGQEAGQEAMYVGFASGGVELVTSTRAPIPLHAMKAANDNARGVLPLEM